MKRLLIFIWCVLSLCPVFADIITDETTAATSYTVGSDGYTYIMNASEFLKLVEDCATESSEEKKIRLLCDIEFAEDQTKKYCLKYFKGEFDGMGSTIKNYQYNDVHDEGAAFIQNLGGNSEVKNIRFVSPLVVVSSTLTSLSAAVVVNNIVGKNSSINNIYVLGGKVTNPHGLCAGIVGKINKNTTISYCSLVGLDIAAENEHGMICYGLVDGVEESKCNCSISNCFVASNPIETHSYFSKPDPGENCYYSSDCLILPRCENEYYNRKNVTKIDIVYLKSGNNSVLNDEDKWVYVQDSVPRPKGLFFWQPTEEYTLTQVGETSSGGLLSAVYTPVEYGRIFDSTPLKMKRVFDGLSSSATEQYVFYDKVLNTYIPLGDRNAFYNPVTELAENAFNGIPAKSIQLPGLVTEVEGNTFKHQVTEQFISNGSWIYDGEQGLLYFNTSETKRLMASIGNYKERTIDGRLCTTIIDEVFYGQTNLKQLFINTWFPVGTTSFDPIELLGDYTFSGCPDDLEVYVKDGTSDGKIIGKDHDSGYKNKNKRWTVFYSVTENPNRLFQYYPVKRNPSGLSTLMLGYPVKLPSDCKAWIATGVETGIENDILKLKRVSGKIVPANLPVLLTYDPTITGTVNLSPYTGTDAPASTAYEGGIFGGSIDPCAHTMNDSEKMTNFLTLSRPTGETSYEHVGFYLFHPVEFEGEKYLPSYVAWISVNKLPANGKFSLEFVEDEDISTGLSGVTVKETPAPLYNLSGQRVGSDYKGIVIKNGRKFLVK